MGARQGGGGGGGRGSAEQGWGLKLFVMDRGAGECGKFQSRVDGMVGRRREGGVYVCNKCDKERREWTGQSASGELQMWQQLSKQ